MAPDEEVEADAEMTLWRRRRKTRLRRRSAEARNGGARQEAPVCWFFSSVSSVRACLDRTAGIVSLRWHSGLRSTLAFCYVFPRKVFAPYILLAGQHSAENFWCELY
jgi:hypothetical protein